MWGVFSIGRQGHVVCAGAGGVCTLFTNRPRPRCESRPHADAFPPHKILRFGYTTRIASYLPLHRCRWRAPHTSTCRKLSAGGIVYGTTQHIHAEHQTLTIRTKNTTTGHRISSPKTRANLNLSHHNYIRQIPHHLRSRRKSPGTSVTENHQNPGRPV